MAGDIPSSWLYFLPLPPLTLFAKVAEDADLVSVAAIVKAAKRPRLLPPKSKGELISVVALMMKKLAFAV